MSDSGAPGSNSLAAGLAQKHLPMIDSLRAIAVFLVIFYHLGLPVDGGLGVLMFFVISGFLITWLLLKEYDKYREVSLRRFYIRRSLRIFPAFYAYAALLLGYTWLRHRAVFWPQTIASLLYYNNYYQAIFGDPNTGFSHTWSLGVEEQFYLLWPSLYLIWKARLPALKRVLTGTIAAIWIYRAVLQFVLHVHQGYIYEAFDTRADHLLIGCLLAVVLWTERSNPRLQSFAAPWQLAAAVLLLTGSGVLGTMYGPDYRDSAGFILNPLLTAVLIVQLIACRDLPLVSWLQASPIRYLGAISYSLYLYQQLVLGITEKTFAAYPAAIGILASCLAVIAAASGSYYIVEKPFLRLKERFGATERPAPGR